MVRTLRPFSVFEATVKYPQHLNFSFFFRLIPDPFLKSTTALLMRKIEEKQQEGFGVQLSMNVLLLCCSNANRCHLAGRGGTREEWKYGTQNREMCMH